MLILTLQVEEWLLQLSQMPFWSRTYAEALLSRNPELLYLQDSSRITETVQVLADAIHDRALMRPWFFADKVVLQLVER